MQGIVVVGVSTGAGEREVANALGAVEVLEPGTLVAAKLAGEVLEPESLIADVQRAGESAQRVIVATSGGLLGPITERFANRDLARELGLPLVLAVPAQESLAGPALLALESARGSGLA